jgi:hypothetical protein
MIVLPRRKDTDFRSRKRRRIGQIRQKSMHPWFNSESSQDTEALRPDGRATGALAVPCVTRDAYLVCSLVSLW